MNTSLDNNKKALRYPGSHRQCAPLRPQRSPWWTAGALLIALWTSAPVAAELPQTALSQEAAEAQALEEQEGLYVVVQATQRPLDGALVLPPACGPYRTLCGTIHDVLHNDLHLSGVVRALTLSKSKTMAIKKYAPPYFEIHRKAALKEAVVYAIGSWVRRSRKHPGMIDLRVDVYDVRAGKLLNLGAEAIHSGPPSQIRQITHRASNAVFGALTGVKGSFDSQIFYSAPGKTCDRCIWVADADGYNAKVVVGDAGVHMLPRQIKNGGFSYVSFRTMLPSLFQITGAEIDRAVPGLPNLRTPPPELLAQLTRAKNSKRSSKRRHKSRRANKTAQKSKTKKIAAQAPPSLPRSLPLASSDTLQFRTAAQNVRGQIAATINDGDQADIWLLDKSGHPVVNLTKNEADDLDPTWSPDGSLLAFVSDRSGSPQIYVVGADGSGLQRLTYAGRYNTGPDWGPNGKIIYSGLRGSAVDILTIDMNKQMQRLTPGKGRRSLEPSWSPSGRRAVYVSDEDGAGARLWIASHDGAVRHPLALPAARYYTPAWRRLPGQRPIPFTSPSPIPHSAP